MGRRTTRYNRHTTGEIVARSAAVLALLGGVALTVDAINSDPTVANYGFEVECANRADEPTVLFVDQQDIPSYTKDHDMITLGCGPSAKIPISIEFMEYPGDANVLVTVRYHNGVLDAGAPTVTVESGGVIGFTGESTITNWREATSA